MLKDNARDLRKKMTEAERALWSLLRRKQIANHRFRKQVPIGKYIVDFACLEARVTIEVDGGQIPMRQRQMRFATHGCGHRISASCDSGTTTC